jgi:hypothetical protein
MRPPYKELVNFILPTMCGTSATDGLSKVIDPLQSTGSRLLYFSKADIAYWQTVACMRTLPVDGLFAEYVPPSIVDEAYLT